MLFTRVLLAIALLAFALIAWDVSFGGAGRGADAVIEERRLIVVGEGPLGRPIRAAVGDVIQIRPFSFPVGPAFIGAKLKVEFPRDPTVQHQRVEWILLDIGQVEDPSPREGRIAISAFFLVAAKGRQDIHISLLDGEGLPLGERYKRTYVVKSGG